MYEVGGWVCRIDLGMTIELQQPASQGWVIVSFVMPNLAAWVHAEAVGQLGVSGQTTDIAAC